MLAQPPDAPALVKLPVDQLSVDAERSGNNLTAEKEVLFQGRPGLIQLGILQAHENHLVNGPAVIVFHGLDAQSACHGCPPALNLAVVPLVPAEEIPQFPVSVGGVLCLNGAEHPLGMEGFQGQLQLLPGHGAVINHLIPIDHIPTGAGYRSVKTVLEQRGQHSQIPAGAQQHLVSLGLGSPDGFQGAVRGHIASRTGEGAVNIQKNPFLFHRDSLRITVYPSLICRRGCSAIFPSII